MKKLKFHWAEGVILFCAIGFAVIIGVTESKVEDTIAASQRFIHLEREIVDHYKNADFSGLSVLEAGKFSVVPVDVDIKLHTSIRKNDGFIIATHLDRAGCEALGFAALDEFTKVEINGTIPVYNSDKENSKHWSVVKLCKLELNTIALTKIVPEPTVK